TPAVVIESPRGIADATLGALSDVVRRADLIVLLGKALDFTTRRASGGAFDPAVRVISLDPEPALVERAAKEVGERLVLGCIADVRTAAETLIARALAGPSPDVHWPRQTPPAAPHPPPPPARLPPATTP